MICDYITQTQKDAILIMELAAILEDVKNMFYSEDLRTRINRVLEKANERTKANRP